VEVFGRWRQLPVVISSVDTRGLSLLLAIAVDVGVGQDPVQPGFEVCAGPERAKARVGLHHRFLQQSRVRGLRVMRSAPHITDLAGNRIALETAVSSASVSRRLVVLWLRVRRWLVRPSTSAIAVPSLAAPSKTLARVPAFQDCHRHSISLARSYGYGHFGPSRPATEPITAFCCPLVPSRRHYKRSNARSGRTGQTNADHTVNRQSDLGRWHKS